MKELLLDLAAVRVGTDLMNQDLDPCLVDVIAPSVAIIDTQARLDIAEQVVGGHEISDFRRDHRGAAHTTADEDATAENTVTLHQLDADIVQAHCRAVFGRGDDRDLELARQIAEFRVEGAPLAQQFGPDARIGDLVGCGPGILVRADVADAISTGLDGVHLDRCQFGQDVGRV